jgi:hypothetical protein
MNCNNRIIKAFLLSFSFVFASNIYGVGLYDANYENNLLKIPLIKVGDLVYEVTMIREDSAALARIGCTEFCFRLATAEVAKNYASSIYSFYDSSTDVATIDNLWFQNRVYKVSLKYMGVINGGQYFNLVNADQKRGLPVYLTSYENKNNIGFEDTAIPPVEILGIPKLFEGEIYTSDRSLTLGDFTQEGKFTAFLTRNRSENLYGVPNINDTAGVSYFVQQDLNGRWTDITNKLLPNKEDRVACVSSSYSFTADFNNDGIPDVYMACHGVDADLSNIQGLDFGATQSVPQHILLSQSDGTFKRVESSFKIYGHKAAIADIDGDGNADIVTVSPHSLSSLPFVLWGKGDGTFIRDDTIFSNDLWNFVSRWNSGVWNVELVPVNGKINLFMIGALTTLIIEDIEQKFKKGIDFSKAVKIDMPFYQRTGDRYSMLTDTIFINGSYYFSATVYQTQSTKEMIISVLKYDLNGVYVDTVYEFINSPGEPIDIAAQIKPHNGNFIAYGAGCSAPQGSLRQGMGMCAMNVPITVTSPAATNGVAPFVSITGGNNQIISDADNIKGETVTLTATATDSDGTIVSTQWLVSGRVVATGTTATLSLNDGATLVTFRATDNSGATSSTTATITVAAPKPLFYYGTSLNDNINQDDLKLPDWSVIYGGAGDDTITLKSGTAVGDAGNDLIIGTSGGSMVVYWTSPSGIIADLSTGIVEDGFRTRDFLTNIRSIQGSPYDDRIKGSQFDESFAGLGGNNFVDGGGGNDTYTVFRKNAYERSKILYEKTTDTFIIEYVDDSGVTFRDTLVNIHTVYLESEKGFVRKSRNDYI